MANKDPTSVAVVFLDMIGSTATGAYWGESQLRELQKQLIQMVDAVLRNQKATMVEKQFLGDGFMLAFADDSQKGADLAMNF